MKPKIDSILYFGLFLFKANKIYSKPAIFVESRYFVSNGVMKIVMYFYQETDES